jgi:hypothetical protein
MGAHDSPDGEQEVPRPDALLELTVTQSAAERVRPSFLVEPRSRGQAYAELRQRVDGGWEPRPFAAPRTELGRFDPERAALPPTSLDAAASYVERHRAMRPWLVAADAASPEARRILAAADAGGGHAHIRHEGWVTEEGSMRRAAYREDPAQLDQGKRGLGIDGLRQGDQPTVAGVLRHGSPIRTPSLPHSLAVLNIRKSGMRWTWSSTQTERPRR